MTKDELIEQARRHLSEAIEADQENRSEALSDLEHLAGMQWDEDVKEAREANGRPCLTINRLPQFVRQVTGDLRRLNPAIKVIPSDEQASEETAGIIAGIVRGIEYDSKASAVYEGAAESAAQCGIGHFRVLTEYESDESFNQRIRIERIHNPFAVYWDPAARESTREDASWCCVKKRGRQVLSHRPLGNRTAEAVPNRPNFGGKGGSLEQRNREAAEMSSLRAKASHKGRIRSTVVLHGPPLRAIPAQICFQQEKH